MTSFPLPGRSRTRATASFRRPVVWIRGLGIIPPRSGPGRLVLRAQQRRDLGREPSEDGAVSVDGVPGAVDVGRLWLEGTHVPGLVDRSPSHGRGRPVNGNSNLTDGGRDRAIGRSRPVT